MGCKDLHEKLPGYIGKQARYSKGYYCRECEACFDAHIQKNGWCGCCGFRMRAAAHRQPEKKPRSAVPSELRPKLEQLA